MDNVENCNCYSNLPSAQTVYNHVFMASNPPPAPGEKSPRYPLDRRLDEPQSRSGRLGENSRLFRDSNFDFSVVRRDSQSPYRLSYPRSYIVRVTETNSAQRLINCRHLLVWISTFSMWTWYTRVERPSRQSCLGANQPKSFGLLFGGCAVRNSARHWLHWIRVFVDSLSLSNNVSTSHSPALLPCTCFNNLLFAK
jgi:hypothetical protein